MCIYRYIYIYIYLDIDIIYPSFLACQFAFNLATLSFSPAKSMDSLYTGVFFTCETFWNDQQLLP